MERSAAAKNLYSSISDGKSTSYTLCQRPQWVEHELENYVITKNYDSLLIADTKTQEELDKIEIKAGTLISRDQLKTQFASDGIFYDVTKQAHFKLLKKA